jgi:lysozyme family protein
MMEELIKINGYRWIRAKYKVEVPMLRQAKALVSAKLRYQAVTALTKVPWWVVAVIHERESSQSWAANLAQGDPWNRVSIHVPRGIGPFQSWAQAAAYAMIHCGPKPALWKNWSAGGTLTLLEEYNGLGYAHRGVASPYIWAGTDQYRSGKFIADGHFDPAAVDKQIGCAALLRSMIELDPTIKVS